MPMRPVHRLIHQADRPNGGAEWGVGVAALALAVAVIWVPALAPGLHGTSQMMDMAGS